MAMEFIEGLIKESPYKKQTIQTDNRLEFEKNFDEYI